MTKTKLKPCPFCGKKAELIIYEPDSPYARYSIRCDNDNCRVWTVATGAFDKEIQAAAAWNKRAK